jgi:chaperone BCS1
MAELLWDFLWDQIKHNNFLSGGAVLMVVGAIAAYFRAAPGKLFRLIKSLFIIEIEVSNRDPAFLWIAQWLAVQPYSQKWARRLTVTTINGDTNGPPRQAGHHAPPPRIILTPSAGRHYFRFRRRWLSLSREQKDGGDGDGKTISFFTRELFKVSIFSRRREIVHQLLDEARKVAEPPEDDRRAIWTYQRYNSWCSTLRRRPRPIESVILAKGIMESIIGDVQAFLGEEQWYIEHGIPYRRTYLLYGPPGSGKSSMVWAIASHLKMDLAVVNMAVKGMGDDDLRNCLADMPANSVGLIEDIDCIFQDRSKSDDDDSYVTFSGLLNALDGVAAAEGRVMFITTNHRDKLDAALLRPGRCDVHYEIGNADSSQVCRIFDRFFSNATPQQTFAFVDQIQPGKVSMAALQGHLNKHKHNIEAAIRHADELCTN